MLAAAASMNAFDFKQLGMNPGRNGAIVAAANLLELPEIPDLLATEFERAFRQTGIEQNLAEVGHLHAHRGRVKSRQKARGRYCSYYRC